MKIKRDKSIWMMMMIQVVFVKFIDGFNKNAIFLKSSLVVKSH